MLNQFQRRILLSILSFLLIFSSYAQLYINEAMPSNDQTILDPDYQSSADWIELYNGSPDSINIGGYYLTDNLADPQKWQIPDNTIIQARGYILIWADDVELGLHTCFKLSSSGETIALYDTALTLIDSMTYSSAPVDISYGRTIDGEYTMGLLAIPTPGTNNLDAIVRGYAPEPSFSVPAGFYTENKSVSLSTNLAGAVIRYTTDGSTPNSSSPIYEAPVTIRPTTRPKQYPEIDGDGNITINTRTLKARVFHPEYLPSRVVGNTYFINERDFDLPVISISTDEDSLFGDDWGIYVRGNGNGLCGRGAGSLRNWNRDWERPVYFEYFDKDKQRHISQTCGASIMGGYSRLWDQKSLNIEADRKYDIIDRLNYKFFEHKNISSFESITLRNSGNDFDGSTTMLRDCFTHALIRDIENIDYQEFTPAVVFINGEYWGMQNIRERLNNYYVEQNHDDVDADNIDFLKNNHEDTIYSDNCDPTYTINNVKHGDAIHYESMVDFLETNDLSIQSNYEHAKTLIDIDEFINYCIVNIFVSNDDWPNNNTRYWRPRTANGKWRWITYDTDFGWGIWGRSETQPTLLRALGDISVLYPNNYTGDEWAVVVLRNLIESDEFVEEFVQRFMAYLGNTFSPSNLESTLNSIASDIEYEIPYHFDRWGKNENWNYNVDDMLNWAVNGRIDYIQNSLLDRFGYSGTNYLTINKYGNGNTTANNSPIYSGNSVEFVSSIPVRLKAEADPGYEFICWMRVTGPPQNTTIIDLGSEWKYNDLGEDIHAQAWKSLSFDDSGWESGIGRLGYGDDFVTTNLSYGDDSDNKHPCYYFRKTFVIDNIDDLNSMLLETTFDDGIVVYINGIEVYRYNMNQGETSYDQLATNGQNDSNETRLYETYVPTSVFQNGDNIIAVEIHQQSTSSSTDMGFDLQLTSQTGLPSGTIVSRNSQLTLTLTGDDELAAIFDVVQPISGVRINEVMASNQSVITDEYGEYEDWIELYNTGTEAVNVGGCYLTDDLSNQTLYRIPMDYPDSTTIAPGGYLILWADKDPEQGIRHLDFSISGNGESVGLYQPSGNNIITLDEITFQSQTADISYGSIPNGSTNRESTVPTPGAENAQLETIENIFINEFVASNNGSLQDNYGEFEDWIEIYNAGTEPINIGGLYITDDLTRPDKYRIPTDYPDSTTIAPGEFLLLWADNDIEQGILHLDFTLSASGEAIGLGQNTGGGISYLDQITYQAQISDVSMARYPNGTGSFETTFYPTPSASNERTYPSQISGIFINEVASENGSYDDNRGQSDDWIEIYNANDFEVNIGGLFISDSIANQTLWRIPSVYPDSTTIPANGYLVLWADNDLNQGIGHLGFKLSSQGESVGLFQAIDSDIITIDTITYNNQIEDITFGRFEDGMPNIEYLSPTPLAENERLDRRTVVCEIFTNVDTLDFILTPDQTTYDTMLVSATRIIYDVTYTSPYTDVEITSTIPTRVQGGVSTADINCVDGSITYTINITKELSTDASLTSLSTNAGQLEPAFNPDIHEYIVYLNPATTNNVPVVSAQPADEMAITGISQAIGVPGIATISVTAEDTSYNELYYVSFEMTTNEYAIIPRGSEWKYNDFGVSLDTINWKTSEYADTAWNTGQAILGYGDNPTTTIEYGSDADHKYPCYYFRRSFTIDNRSELSDFEMSIRKDDGVVVYINEIEVYRSNMQDTTDVIYNEWALETCSDDCETTYTDSVLDDALFVQGENIIAIEVHQADSESTDLTFDFELRAQRVLTAETRTQTIHLQEGWNLISLNVVAYDMSPSTLFADIMDNVEIIKNFFDVYIPGGTENTLSNLRDGKAYFVKMRAPADLIVEGSPLNGGSVTIMLSPGWNLVGYPVPVESPVSSSVNSIINKIRVIKRENKHFNPALPTQVNSLQYFIPGHGYLLNAKVRTPFSFPNIEE